MGRTLRLEVDRRAFYEPEAIVRDVEKKVPQALGAGVSIDCVGFVPDVEPTLDVNLGPTIGRLKSFGIKIAVITNGALIDREDVRRDLLEADWISLKVDAVRDDLWHRVDRPHRSLRLESVLEGALAFSRVYRGRQWSSPSLEAAAST